MNQSLSYRLGKCVLCGDRVFSDESFIKTSDGYCHRNCITEKTMLEA